MITHKVSFIIPPAVNHTFIRYLRGAVTFPIKVEQKKKPFTKKLLEKTMEPLKRENPGMGEFMYSRKMIVQKPKISPTVEDYEHHQDTSDNVEYVLQENIKSSLKNESRKRLFNIKRKYFKSPKLPNMVPYVEKQTMKILHERDPENWDPEQLAESYPVTPAIAFKILKSRFTAHTVEQVRKHDRTVQRNWQLFKEGKLELSEELKNHYSKFLDRVSFETSEEVIKQFLPPPVNFKLTLKKRDFSKIIDDYVEKTSGVSTSKSICIDENEKLVFEAPDLKMNIISENVTGISKNKSPITLSKYREKLEEDDEMNELSQLIVKEKPKPSLSTVINREMQEVDYFDEDGVVCKEYEHSLPKVNDKFPLRIAIPQDRKGCSIYQVQDRFYDKKGFFLYRVPGLFS